MPALTENTSFLVRACYRKGLLRTKPSRQLIGQLEYQDLIMSPTAFRSLGLENSYLLNALNIGYLRFVSGPSLANPKGFALLLTNLMHCQTLDQYYRTILWGVAKNMITILPATPSLLSPTLPFDLCQALKERHLGFQVVDHESLHGTFSYRLEAFDALNERLVRLRVLIDVSEDGSGQQVRIHSLLPHDSPHIVFQLNTLFGQAWLYKAREKFPNASHNQLVEYVWLSRAPEKTPTEEESYKFRVIEDQFVDDRNLITGLNLNWGALLVDPTTATSSPTVRDSLLVYLESEINDALRSRGGQEGSTALARALLWDLAIIREQRKL